MKRKQKSEHSQFRSLKRFNREGFWKHLPLDLYVCNQQMQLLIRDLGMNPLPAHSAFDAPSSCCNIAFNPVQDGCEACQCFTFMSILHVICQMQVNPHFAQLLVELARCSLQGNLIVMTADTQPHLPSMPTGKPVEPLTHREMEVLHLMAKQHSYRDIAKMLFISPLTVKTHVHKIFRKLGVNRRRLAIQRAHTLGLVQAV
jgi:DNA-binding CsgD family transcriptional regulator